ncbi:MAG: DUF1801 domain-containing protein, partial [Candidatus Thermoplasmatota archaeon]|nr:DUF1801 domain-containing protein [Candidatus Thermoplasmatota archaeon]
MDKKVVEYIQKQKSPLKEILQKLRKIILTTVPEINEEMRVGVPCYGYTKKDSCGKYYIVALKDHVNLGFSLKGLSKKEQTLFEGTGKTMKHIKVYSLKEMDEK